MRDSSIGHRAMIVSFSGVDGAGKSTQIDALRSHFSAQGFDVRVVAFWDHVARLTRFREGAGHRLFKGEKGVGTPSAPIHRRDKNVRAFPVSCVRLILYSLDAFATRRAVRAAIRSGADLVIFDRYLYDELANLQLHNPLLRAYVRCILLFVPRPDISFLLDAEPEKARARKPEYPVEFVRMNRQSYIDLSSLVGTITMIPPASVSEVREVVLRSVLTAMTSEEQSPRRDMDSPPQPAS